MNSKPPLPSNLRTYCVSVCASVCVYMLACVCVCACVRVCVCVCLLEVAEIQLNIKWFVSILVDEMFVYP